MNIVPRAEWLAVIDAARISPEPQVIGWIIFERHAMANPNELVEAAIAKFPRLGTAIRMSWNEYALVMRGRSAESICGEWKAHFAREAIQATARFALIPTGAFASARDLIVAFDTSRLRTFPGDSFDVVNFPFS